ncbi:DNA polymerase IV [Bacteroidota bacterium]
MKKIIHIDMDAFFASVEQRDNPDLQGKPVAVGSASGRGVVAAASYEAREFGVRSAMPSQIALRRCPDLIFVPHRFDIYKSISGQIMDIFHDYTDLVEPLSLDEAFLDVTANKKNMPSATLIAQEIRTRIKENTQLTASAGISINKFLAKIASDVNKPDGIFLIPPEKANDYIEKLPIEKFHGIGKATADKMHNMGIKNGLDLKQISELELITRFGKMGHYFYQISRAIDEREVTPNRIRKSLGAENTFPTDIKEMEDIRQELDQITEILIGRIAKSGTKGKTLTIKVKYADFQQITRSKSVDYWISDREQITALYEELLGSIEIGPGIRLLGLTLSHLNHEESNVKNIRSQLTLDF